MSIETIRAGRIAEAGNLASSPPPPPRRMSEALRGHLWFAGAVTSDR